MSAYADLKASKLYEEMTPLEQCVMQGFFSEEKTATVRNSAAAELAALRRRVEQAEQIDHARLLKLLQTIWDEAEHLSVFYNGEMQWAVDALAAYRETEQS